MLINDQCNWDEEINLRFLQRWISRAGSRPLDPCLIPSTFSGPLSTLNIPRYSKQISKLLPMLLSYSSQWRSLDITLYPSTPFTSDTYTRLVSLVKLTATMLLPQVPFIMTTFRDAPALREVSLASLGPLQSILLPWIQLTHLNLAKISVPKSLEILKQTPNLEVLDIFPQPSASPSCELTIAHLHTFTFRGCHYTLLDRLTLPSLRTLQLYGLRSDGVPRLLEMGIRSSWSPRAISLDTMGQETSTLCLRNSKKEHFSLLIELLSSDDQFLPALCEITIKSPTEISLPAVADMLVSRWRGHREGVAKLKSFHLAFSHSTEITASAFHELTSRVRLLLDQGLDIQVTLIK
ncbi:hypothetical protein DFH08DRAFT_965224 [Mycena albidolilacea]|uniref:Uncharacterized protein n=1 Tax=Mycena albidolilacea TaxID=1033008 RepID=A0AAD6ZSF7_9AGAR|nr:hypothetical protein DFH08DRAFT_965224 [Mycena albidolilacea]